MNREKRLLLLITLLSVFTALFWLLSCDEDDDDDDDNDEGNDERADLLCEEDFENMTCLQYCRCQRLACVETFSTGECDAEMCKCAEQFGCLYHFVVDDYQCYE